MTDKDYLNLQYCDTKSKLDTFCRRADIIVDISWEPHETIIKLERYGDSITKTIPSYICFDGEIIKQIKIMITYLLGREPVTKDLAIKNVIFNDPATIVFWTDGTKTVVKAKNEPFDPEKGLAMAMSKKFLGNKGNYFNEFKRWLPEKEEESPYDEQLEKVKEVVKDIKPEKPKFKVGDLIRCIYFPDITATILSIHKFSDPSNTAVIRYTRTGNEVVVSLNSFKLVQKTCSNCKHVKPFSNPICDKCTGADKFEAKEEKDG